MRATLLFCSLGELLIETPTIAATGYQRSLDLGTATVTSQSENTAWQEFHVETAAH